MDLRRRPLAALAASAGLLVAATASLNPTPAHAGNNAKGSSYPRGQWWTRTPVSGAEVVVRPDALRMTFTLVRVHEDPEAALATLEQVAAAVQTRFADVRGAKTAVVLTAGDVSVWTDDKGKNPTPQVSLAGVVELPLPAEADLLQRVRWLTSLVKLRDALAAEHGDARKGVRFYGGNPGAVVLDPDAHRAALLTRWAARAQEFVAAAQTPGAPLAVVDCKAPGVVQQATLSLDAVKLQIELECRVDVAGGRSAPAGRP